MKYVKVVIDNTSNHTDTLYTYACSFEHVAPGSRVRVPFGKGNRLKDAYVFEVLEEEAALEIERSKIKEVESADEDVSLPEDLVHLCRWMRDTYLCRYIDAVKCMIPPGEKGSRGTRKDPYESLAVQPSEPPELTEEQKAVMEQNPALCERRRSQDFSLKRRHQQREDGDLSEDGSGRDGKRKVIHRSGARDLSDASDYRTLHQPVRFRKCSSAAQQTDESAALGAVAEGPERPGKNPHRSPSGRICAFFRSRGDHRGRRARSLL